MANKRAGCSLETVVRAGLGSGMVVLILLIIAVLAVITLLRAADAGASAAKLLGLLLPVFGTWVGTVLTFFYTKESMDAAHRQTLDVLRTASDRLTETPVASAMIDIKDIKHISLAAGAGLDDVVLGDIGALMQSPAEGDGKRVSRVPVLSNDLLLVALIHRAAWAEMQLDGRAAAPPLDFTAGKLGVLLDLPCQSPVGTTFRDLLTKGVAYVARDRTLADAKAAMEAITGCQDVMVTKSGRADEPVLGWITNVDLVRVSKA